VSATLVYALNVNLFDLIYVALSAQLSLICVSLTVLYSRPDVRHAGGASSIALGLFSSASFVIWAIASGQPTLVVWGPIIAVGGALVGLSPALWHSRVAARD
jgi:hypothetical protein